MTRPWGHVLILASVLRGCRGGVAWCCSVGACCLIASPLSGGSSDSSMGTHFCALLRFGYDIHQYVLSVSSVSRT